MNSDLYQKVLKEMRSRGKTLSSSIKDSAKKRYGAILNASNSIETLYSAAAKKKPRKPRKRKIWIRRDIKRPGWFRRLAENAGLASPGESIPYRVKDKGCQKPDKIYKELTGKKPSAKKSRRFQKAACLARTFYRFPAAHRGPSKRYYATSTVGSFFDDVTFELTDLGFSKVKSRWLVNLYGESIMNFYEGYPLELAIQKAVNFIIKEETVRIGINASRSKKHRK